MKASNIIYAILTSLCIVSCAHKSGHNRPQAASHSENTGMRDTQTSNVTRGGQRNLEVTVSNSRGDKNKLQYLWSLHLMAIMVIKGLAFL